MADFIKILEKLNEGTTVKSMRFEFNKKIPDIDSLWDWVEDDNTYVKVKNFEVIGNKININFIGDDGDYQDFSDMFCSKFNAKPLKGSM